MTQCESLPREIVMKRNCADEVYILETCVTLTSYVGLSCICTLS